MITQLPIFLSLVITTRNQADQIQALLIEISRMLDELVSDYELVIVDNASDDDSLLRLKALTGADGLPNLQVYALTKEVDADTASWVGLENALGDFVAVIDPLNDDISFLPEMLDKAVSGVDVVFANNQQKPAQSFAYRGAYAVFNMLYKWFSGIHLAKEAPQYRVLSKCVVNFILQHPQPAVTYRHLPATGGFSRVNLSYSARPKISHTKRLG
ncbi:MAG: glycosyltransferase, partial [Methylobacter sp.]